jgi:outer membrane immunogenic protein
MDRSVSTCSRLVRSPERIGDGLSCTMSPGAASLVMSLVALIVIGSALSANADEYKRPAAPQQAQAPAPQQASNWTGGQFGAFGGDSSLAQNFTEPGAFLCSTLCETPFGFRGQANSFTGGVFAGYRVQFGNFVVGAETDIAWKKGQTSQVQSDLNTLGTPEVFTGSLEQNWDGSVRARFGALVTPSVLFYSTAGLAFSNIQSSFSYTATCAACGGASVAGAGSFSETRTGYTVGSGLEVAIAYGLKARLEYRYTDFGHFSYDVPLHPNPSCGLLPCGTNAHVDLNAAFHTVRVGLGVDF